MKRIIVILFVAVSSVSARQPVNDLQGKLLADWIQVHLKLVRANKGVGHVAYSRHFSYTSIAFYESIAPAYKKYISLSGQLQGYVKKASAPSKLSAYASGNAAYAAMLRFFYASNPKIHLVDSLERSFNELLLGNAGDTSDCTASAEYGKKVAEEIIEWSKTDRQTNQVSYQPRNQEGFWTPTPPSFSAAAAPGWGTNRVMFTGSRLDNSYHSLNYDTNPSSAFYVMVKDLYDVSNSLTEEQKQIGLFWDDSPNGKYCTVFGHWSSILGQVILKERLSLMKSAEAFVKMHIALHDASIVAWQGKYKFEVVRPVTYIQKNIDFNWQPIIETPPHPEFPAAHATLSSAAAAGLSNALGNAIDFTDFTYSDLGMGPRKFKSFQQAAEEAGISRLYGGIHYRHSIEVSLKLGKQVAENIFTSVKLRK